MVYAMALLLYSIIFKLFMHKLQKDLECLLPWFDINDDDIFR